MEKVTFIIPTIGRKSLTRTLDSLIKQSIPEWEALVVFDGIQPTIFNSDSRIAFVNLPTKIGQAGLVRNEGIEEAQTSWLAFVDDDDWLDENYLKAFNQYLAKNPDLDVIIFTYYDAINKNTQPPKGTRDFVECGVGISFAVRKAFIDEHNIRFTKFGIEDFRFLDACRKAGAKYLVTNDIKYYVGGRGGWRN